MTISESTVYKDVLQTAFHCVLFLNFYKSLATYMTSEMHFTLDSDVQNVSTKIGKTFEHRDFSRLQRLVSEGVEFFPLL